MSTLRSCISYIEIMKGHILDNFFFLVNISFWNRDILFCFKIELSCISVRATNTLYSTTSSFDINYIAYRNFLFLNVFINTRV